MIYGAVADPMFALADADKPFGKQPGKARSEFTRTLELQPGHPGAQSQLAALGAPK